MFRRQCFVVHTNKQLLTLLSMWALRKDMTLRVQFCLCVFFFTSSSISVAPSPCIAQLDWKKRIKNTTCQNAITFMRMVTLQRKSNENIQHFPYTHTHTYSLIHSFTHSTNSYTYTNSDVICVCMCESFVVRAIPLCFCGICKEA